MKCAIKNTTKIKNLQHLNAALVGMVAAMAMAMIFGCAEEPKSRIDYQEETQPKPLEIANLRLINATAIGGTDQQNEDAIFAARRAFTRLGRCDEFLGELEASQQDQSIVLPFPKTLQLWQMFESDLTIKVVDSPQCIVVPVSVSMLVAYTDDSCALDWAYAKAMVLMAGAVEVTQEQSEKIEGIVDLCTYGKVL